MVRTNSSKSAHKQKIKQSAKRNPTRVAKSGYIVSNTNTTPPVQSSDSQPEIGNSPNPFAVLSSSDSSRHASNDSSSFHPSSSSTASASQQPLGFQQSHHDNPTNHTFQQSFKDVVVNNPKAAPKNESVTPMSSHPSPSKPSPSPSKEEVPTGILSVVKRTNQVLAETTLSMDKSTDIGSTKVQDQQIQMKAVTDLVLLKLDHLEVKINDIEKMKSVHSTSSSRSRRSRSTTVPVNVETQPISSQPSNNDNSALPTSTELVSSVVHGTEQNQTNTVQQPTVSPANVPRREQTSLHHLPQRTNHQYHYYDTNGTQRRNGSVTSETTFEQPQPQSNTIYQTNQFNQNKFSLLVTGAAKLKFASMQIYLKDKSLTNETAQAFEEIYTHIGMSVSFIFDDSVNVLPSFHQLDKETQFSTVLLHNLCSTTYEKCLGVYQKIGSLLKLFLLSPSFLSKSTAPNVDTIRKANISYDGWTILEAILKDNIVACGARVKFDLDKTRILLVFKDNESYVDFYVRTQNVLNEYKLNYRDEVFIPRIKIADTFVSQLTRSTEYSIHLTTYRQRLEDHIDEFGDVDNSMPLPFTVTDVYTHLKRMKVTLVPNDLRVIKAIPTLFSSLQNPITSIPTYNNETIASAITPPTTDAFHLEPDPELLIDGLDGTVVENCSNPVMCAQIRANNRNRCQACLIGFHDEIKCYLRGPAFQPEELKRRIRVYNQIHGDKPPNNEKPSTFRPGGKHAIHHNSKTSSQRVQFRKPFNNYHTKTNNRKPNETIRRIANSDSFDIDDYLEGDSPNESPSSDDVPTMSSFISDQVTLADNIPPVLDNGNNDGPTICSMLQAPLHPTHQIESVPNPTVTNIVASSTLSTTSSLVNVVGNVPRPLPHNNIYDIWGNDSWMSSAHDVSCITSTIIDQPSYSYIPPTASNPTVAEQIYGENSWYSRLLTSSNDIDFPVIRSSIQSGMDNNMSFATTYHNVDSLPVYDYTPHQLLSAIIKAHIPTRDKPSKYFLTKHSQQLAQLAPSNFETYATVNFHVDGGANVNGIIDKNLFYFYIPCSSNIVQVGGSGLHSPGWGGVIIRNGSISQLIAPVYYFPNNPQNTIATPTLLHYGNCTEVIVNTNRSMTLVNQSTRYTFGLQVHNDLDNVSFEILKFQVTKNTIASAINKSPRRSQRLANILETTTSNPRKNEAHSRRSPRLHIEKPIIPNEPSSSSTVTSPPDTQVPTNDIQVMNDNPLYSSGTSKFPQKFDVYNDNNEYIVTLSRKAMSTIASFSVLLQPSASPRDDTIRAMNSIMGNYFNSIEQNKDLQQKKKLPSPEIHSDVTDPTILTPVMAKLHRATRKESSPFYDWTKMHFSLLHASHSTMDIMIRKQMLSDIPTSLNKKHRFDCYCHICALRKSTKLRKGRSVDKSHLTPFERIHMDYEFFGLESIRGFTSGLNITCGSTSYTICFPCKSRNPPLRIVKYVITLLRNMGYTVIFVRVDEDGALAKSSEFCRLIRDDLFCLLETTGGGNSTNNGVSERSNYTRADMMRSQLTLMYLLFGKHLPQNIDMNMFWCFAYLNAAFVQRRLYCRTHDDVP